MKRFALLSIFLALPLLAQSTSPHELVGGGVSFNNSATPNLMGDLFYATQITGGTYSFTAVDINKITLKPTLQIQTQTETGIAQYVRTISKFDVFATLAGGAAVTGSGNLGGSFSGGTLLVAGLGHNLYLAIPAKAIKSTVGGPTGYMIGVNLAWGK